MQEYNFQTIYRKGSLNANADALSRLPHLPCAITPRNQHSSAALRRAQLNDSVISKILQARQLKIVDYAESTQPVHWRRL